jgi:LemA protein
MKSSIKILLGIGVVVLLLILIVVGSYNGLVARSEAVERALSDIDTQLQRRNDLIPNLVETVRRYATHEEEIFMNLAEARARLAGARTVEEQAEADQAVNTALSGLLAIAENYPDLKANENFIQLQDELAGTENRIAVSRRDYNVTANDYNASIRRFPTNIFAGMFGFERVVYYEADEAARNTPNVGDLFED